MASIISDEQMAQYRDEGYMVLEGAMSPEALTMLREESAYFMGYMDARLDAGLVGDVALSVRGRRYFVNDMYRFSGRLWRFVFGDLMAQVCRATLGPTAVLFNEQWVIKGAENGMSFDWHQDSGYVHAVDPKTQHKPYVTCWCALDDVSEDNGTVYLLPHSRAGTRGKIIEHKRDKETNDLIGYTGDDPGVAITVPAGSVVVFSSYNLHCSGANLTNDLRRVYLLQYADGPICLTHNGEQLNMAVPFLEGGNCIYDHAGDLGSRWGGRDAVH